MLDWSGFFRMILASTNGFGSEKYRTASKMCIWSNYTLNKLLAKRTEPVLEIPVVEAMVGGGGRGYST